MGEAPAPALPATRRMRGAMRMVGDAELSSLLVCAMQQLRSFVMKLKLLHAQIRGGHTFTDRSQLLSGYVAC